MAQSNYYFQVLSYLKNTFCKVIAATDSDSPSESGQSQLKTFWKGFIIPSAIQNICGLWDGVKASTLIGVSEKWIPTLMHDFGGWHGWLSRLVEEDTAHVVETARELKSQVKPEDVTELLHCMAKAEEMRSCFLWMIKESILWRWNLLLVKILRRQLRWQQRI